jgi:septal ring factor EnvC (AmiA/AmiB activator)
MAQEFYAAFGHDKYGVAGNDTTINQADFEGINLIAIKALEKRTDKLKSVQKELKSKTEKLALLKQKVDEQQKQIALQQSQINKLNKMKTEFSAFKKSMISFMNTKNNGANSKIVMNK